MAEITNAETTLLRSQPHSTKLWLSIYQPSTVLACQVNDTDIERGERSIEIDGITSGAVALIQVDMSMWVGTSAGKSDKGIVRVRSASGSTITVAENDHINWADDDFLTVVSFYEINAVFPRIVQEDPDELEVTFYKDYDVAYTDQNSVLGSFVCAGGHYAGWVGDQVYYTATGTYNLKEENLTYDWFFEGADVTGSSSMEPGYISYSNPGHYTTRLTVTNDSGGTDIVQRHISLYDKPNEGTNTPILSWSLQEMNGARDNGGYTGRITIHQSLDEDLVKDGSLVVIFAEDDYGGTKQSIGGNNKNRESIFFVGYVLDGTITFNYHDSQIEFEIGSPTEIMKLAEGFSSTSESSSNPSTWYEVLDQDCRRALYTYLRWQSTVLKTTDVRFIGTDYNIQYFDADRESLYSAVSVLMKTALRGDAVCDRQGKLYLEIDGYTQGITLQNTFTLDKQDWIDEPEIEQAQTDSRSFIEAGGIAYSNAGTGTFSAFLASAPGVAPGYRGKLERFQGLALESQSQLNQLVGDIYAWQNSEYPNNTFLLAGNYRNFDIAPQELVSVNMDASDNYRGVSFFGKSFITWAMSWIYNSRGEVLYPRTVFREKTSGFAGASIIIPDVPDAGGFGNTLPFSFPPLNIPPFNTEIIFNLYDEGILVGDIDEIDFQGSPVTATKIGAIGTVTYDCTDTPNNTDSIAFSGSKSSQAFFCSGGEQELLAAATVHYTNGVTQSGTKYVVGTAGVYSVGINGNFNINSNNLCNNKGSSYNGTVYIKHYNSSDVLQSTYEVESGQMYCFDSGSGDVAIDDGWFNKQQIISMSASDYVIFSFEATCPDPSDTATINGLIYLYRIT